ncbi:MAG: AraC family transcriptional regulator [Butyrivibrio sp.]|nr:AraC family transcriptional regulator [Butyrivibrio sp.]
MADNITRENNVSPAPENIESRITLLTELLQCNSRMIVSRYNLSGTLIYTNAENMIYDTMLRYSKRLDDAIAFGKTNSYPIIITTDYGLMWSVAFEPDESGNLTLLHTLGPILTSPMTDEIIEQIMKNPSIRIKWRPKLVKYLKDIKVIPATEFFKDTLMLHYCITGVYLKPSDITFLSFTNEDAAGHEKKSGNYAEFYALENSMADFIRNGDINYKEKIPSASAMLSSFQPMTDGSLTDARQMATIFCGLCIRAAIDGGISPDTAYTKSSIYLKNLSSITTFAEIMPICHNLFEDLLFQVHNLNDKPDYSKEVAACISYIETHTDESLNIEYLAERIGYSKYYMSKKFKSETGLSINSYIKKARIDRAAYLLVTTKMDIEEISEKLQFGNRNFFTKIFKEETGTTPAQFRENHKKI